MVDINSTLVQFIFTQFGNVTISRTTQNKCIGQLETNNFKEQSFFYYLCRGFSHTIEQFYVV